MLLSYCLSHDSLAVVALYGVYLVCHGLAGWEDEAGSRVRFIDDGGLRFGGSRIGAFIRFYSDAIIVSVMIQTELTGP